MYVYLFVPWTESIDTRADACDVDAYASLSLPQHAVNHGHLWPSLGANGRWSDQESEAARDLHYMGATDRSLFDLTTRQYWQASPADLTNAGRDLYRIITDLNNHQPLLITFLDKSRRSLLKAPNTPQEAESRFVA
jgi:hypothetical protein